MRILAGLLKIDSYRSPKNYFMGPQKILIGTLSAVAIGMAIGLLVAPAKGSETRQRISDSADGIRRKIRRIRGKADAELDELKEVFEHEVEGLKEDVRQSVLHLIERSRQGYNNIKEEALSN
jgi:gas vesicle protein